MILEGKFDKATSGQTGDAPFVLGSEGGVLVTQVGGARRSSAMRRQIFSAATATTGVAPGTSLSTTQNFAVLNPAESSVNLAILKTAVGYVSGTLGAGTLVYAQVNVGGASVSGTLITPVCARLGAGTAQAKAYTSASTTASATLIRPFANLGAALASTALGLSSAVIDNVDGEFIVPPGYMFVMHGIAAGGSTPLVIYSCVWEEFEA